MDGLLYHKNESLYIGMLPRKVVATKKLGSYQIFW